MQLDRISASIFQVSVYLMKLASANLLWLLFTLLGLVVFGFYPATIALLTVMRQLSQGEDDPIFQTFWRTYKEEFIRGNQIGLIITIILIVFYADVSFLRDVTIGIPGLFYYPALVANYLFLLTSCYALVLHSMYNLTIKQLFKNSFFIMISNPVSTLILIMGTGAIFIFSSFIPWLLFFYGASLWALLLHSATLLALRKVEKNQKSLLEEA